MARLFMTGGVRLEGPDGFLDDGDLPGHQGRLALVAFADELGVAVSPDTASLRAHLHR